jgi:hypothetical protein
MKYTIEQISKIPDSRKRYNQIQNFIKYIKQQKNVIFISITQSITSGVANSNFEGYKIIKEKFTNIEGIDNYWETVFVFGDEKNSIKEKAWKLYGIKENIKKNNNKKNN